MKAAESKTTTAAQHLQAKEQSQQPFFQKEGVESVWTKGTSPFFSANGNKDHQNQPFFNKSNTPAKIQTKLTIGQPGDKYEQEADATADKVVQRLAEGGSKMPDARYQLSDTGKQISKYPNIPISNIQRKPIFESDTEQPIQTKLSPNFKPPTRNIIQAKCAECEQEEKLQKKEEEEPKTLQRKPIFESDTEPNIQTKCAECKQEEQLQQKEASPEQEKTTLMTKAETSTSSNASGLESMLYSTKGSGTPLSDDTRSSMEGAFGADFSNVRVHTNSTAVQMNKDLGAQAFTHGSDIYFNAGKYNPGSKDGQSLLAHELTHTVQQGGNTKPNLQKNGEETPRDKIIRLIADEDDDGIVELSDEELNVSTPAQRAGMIRILLDLWWTSYQEERFAIHALRFQNQANQVLPLIDAIGYRQKFLDSVDDAELKNVLIQTFAQVNVSLEGGDLEIAELLANPESTYEAVMRIQNFTTATNSQRLGLLRIMLEMNWSNKEEEIKIINVLESSGAGLGELMGNVTSLGLKQSLFDHIDDEENAVRFTRLLGSLNDPTLNADLEVFNRGFWGNLWEGITGGLASAWENFSLGSIIMGFLHPIIHPIDSILGLINQLGQVIEHFDFSLRTLDRIVTLLRDTAGFIAMWLLLLSLIASGIAAAVAAGIITIPASIPIAAIAAALVSYTTTVGVIFIVLAIIKFVIDLIQAGTATTERELEREEEEIGQDVTLLGVILIVWGVVKGIRWLRNFRRGAVEPDAADPDALDETAEEGENASEEANESTEEANEKADEIKEEREQSGNTEEGEQTTPDELDENASEQANERANEKQGSKPPEYVNNNPRATPDEIRVGELLNNEANSGNLPSVESVEGAKEIPNERSGDYRFKHPDGSETSADLYQPESGNPDSIWGNIIEKGGQAETVIVELGRGRSGSISNEAAAQMARDVVNQPGVSVTRVIVIRNGSIIFDTAN